MHQKIPGLDDVIIAVEPKARTTTITIDMLAVDLINVNAAEIIVIAGLWTDGTHTFSLLESDDNSTFTTVVAGDLSGTMPVIDGAADDQQVYHLSYTGTKRYLEVKCTVTGSPSTGLVWGAAVARGLKTYRT